MALLIICCKLFLDIIKPSTHHPIVSVAINPPYSIAQVFNGLPRLQQDTDFIPTEPIGDAELQKLVLQSLMHRMLIVVTDYSLYHVHGCGVGTLHVCKMFMCVCVYFYAGTVCG